MLTPHARLRFPRCSTRLLCLDSIMLVVCSCLPPAACVLHSSLYAVRSPCRLQRANTAGAVLAVTCVCFVAFGARCGSLQALCAFFCRAWRKLASLEQENLLLPSVQHAYILCSLYSAFCLLPFVAGNRLSAHLLRRGLGSRSTALAAFSMRLLLPLVLTSLYPASDGRRGVATKRRAAGGTLCASSLLFSIFLPHMIGLASSLFSSLYLPLPIAFATFVFGGSRYVCLPHSGWTIFALYRARKL